MTATSSTASHNAPTALDQRRADDEFEPQAEIACITEETAPGPRIYNLFPLLAGPIEEWRHHVPRIAAMRFDWIYVNPFYQPGQSGNIYAIRDLGRLHPIVEGGIAAPPHETIAAFASYCAGQGIALMIDLPLMNIARDAIVVEQHPDWFRRDAKGTLVPLRTLDVLDPRKELVWHDLADPDFSRPGAVKAMLAFWKKFVRTYISAGVKGFRCGPAHRVPLDFWRALIADARSAAPGTLFAAASGTEEKEIPALAEAGFNFFFNSAKWWDFREDWLLEQQARLPRGVKTIAFPENHETGRLAADLMADNPRLDTQTLEEHYRQRYLFSACFSTGLLMPMGFEFGSAKPLDAIDTRPGDWDWAVAGAPFDLSNFIASVNETKARLRPLNTERPLRRISAPDADIVALFRPCAADARFAEEAAIILINPDPHAAYGTETGSILTATGGVLDKFDDVTPLHEPLEFEVGRQLTLRPLEIRVFLANRMPRPAVELRGPDEDESRARLEALAPRRIAIEGVYPEIDGGRFAIKRCAGDTLEIWADIFSDGHDAIRAVLAWRRQGDDAWREETMRLVDNDRWMGTVPLGTMGRFELTILAWRDLFATWRADTAKKLDAGQPVTLEIIEGRELVERAFEAPRDGLGKAQCDRLGEIVNRLSNQAGEGSQLATLMSDELLSLMADACERTNLTRYERTLEVVVDRTAARFSAWYEMFPRSQSGDPHRHGTFDDVIARLPYVRDLGFDVLYFPPIHPIGHTNRKGRNNSLVAGPDDPGSPYAIGSEDGGHDAIHPQLGTFDDFARLVHAAHEHGLEIALDFAIQCSPDHPWLKEHPEWFDWRPDGSIKFAENPPKKYEDIVNVHFYREAVPSIWYALRDVVLFWIGHGVKIFRVDNPHTKPLPFWEWMIREIKDRHPDVIFLSEAFTRPKMMNRLAKIGFTQSYTYFTWRNTKQELTQYIMELTRSESKEFFRPNFFTNTPDINPKILQSGKRSAFMTRFVLAATLSGNYGIYNGFELCEGTPIPGKEEYLNSEKYEIKAWDWERPGHIRDLIRRVNHIRRANPALHDHLNVEFYNAWNDNILYFGRMTPARDNFVLVAVNLDPDAAHGATFEVPLWEFGLPDNAEIEVVDLLAGHRFVWRGKQQHTWLDPEVNPVHLWRLVPPGAPTERLTQRPRPRIARAVA